MQALRPAGRPDWLSTASAQSPTRRPARAFSVQAHAQCSEERLSSSSHTPAEEKETSRPSQQKHARVYRDKSNCRRHQDHCKCNSGYCASRETAGVLSDEKKQISQRLGKLKLETHPRRHDDSQCRLTDGRSCVQRHTRVVGHCGRCDCLH